MKKFDFELLDKELSKEDIFAKYNLSQATKNSLISYVELLFKWNNVYNLTGIKTPLEMLKKHVFESLLINEHLNIGVYEQILDVGTGAGIPGLILAILNPDMDFELIDSNGKKTRFLLEVTAQLGLKNIKITQARVPLDYEYKTYDVIISRAFTNFGNFFAATTKLANKNTKWFAMKQIVSEKELNTKPSEWNLLEKLDLKTDNASTSLYIFDLLNK